MPYAAAATRQNMSASTQRGDLVRCRLGAIPMDGVGRSGRWTRGADIVMEVSDLEIYFK
jgi:hypothetical protein